MIPAVTAPAYADHHIRPKRHIGVLPVKSVGAFLGSPKFVLFWGVVLHSALIFYVKKATTAL